VEGKILKLVKKNNNNEDGNPLNTTKHEVLIRYNQDIEQLEYMVSNSPKLTLVGLLTTVANLLIEGD